MGSKSFYECSLKEATKPSVQKHKHNGLVLSRVEPGAAISAVILDIFGELCNHIISYYCRGSLNSWGFFVGGYACIPVVTYWAKLFFSIIPLYKWFPKLFFHQYITFRCWRWNSEKVLRLVAIFLFQALQFIKKVLTFMLSYLHLPKNDFLKKLPIPSELQFTIYKFNN